MKRRNQDNNSVVIWISLILVALFAIIFVNIYLQKQQLINEKPVNEHFYNNFRFYNISNQWFTNIQIPGKNTTHSLEMRLSPFDVENISFDESVLPLIVNAKQIYLTVSPNLTGKSIIAMIEVGRLTGEVYNFYNIPTNAALTYSKDGQEEVPIITCKNSTSGTVVLHFLIGNSDKVSLNDVCILIQGTSEDRLIASADRLTYGLAGIMR